MILVRPFVFITFALNQEPSELLELFQKSEQKKEKNKTHNEESLEWTAYRKTSINCLVFLQEN